MAISGETRANSEVCSDHVFLASMTLTRLDRTALLGVLTLVAACTARDSADGDDAGVDGGDAGADVLGLDSATNDASVPTDSIASADGAKDAKDANDAKTDVTPDAPTAPSFPIADPPAGFAGLPAAGPMTISAATGKTISRVAITNPSGPCIVIHGGADIVIDHVAIGPCKGDGIQIDGKATRVTVRDSYIHDTSSNGVSTYQVSAVSVTGSWFARNSSGGYFLESTGVRFEKSSVLNVQGPIPRGQLAQFDKVTGDASNAVRCNVMENRPGESNPEDGINMYLSSGTAAAPIVVEGNRIRGGGPSTSGGGILLGDGGGASAYQISRFNVLVDPGQYGTSVAGGSHMTVLGNLVYAKKQSFTNVGIYVWDQYKSSCSDVTVKDNQVNWTNKDGVSNAWWNAGNCAALTESGNDWKATFTDSIIDRVPDACK